MKRKCGWLLLYTTLLVFATAGIVRVRAVSNPQGHKPFTATVLESDTLIDSPEVPSRLHIVAVREDGSRVDVRQVIGKTVLGSKIVVDVARMTRVFVDMKTRSKTTYKMNEQWLAKYTSIPSPVGDEAGPLIAGMRTIRSPKLKLEGSVWVEHWLAVDLDYFPMRSVFTHPNGTKTKEVVSLSLGTPSPYLFEVPDDFPERSPLEVFRELERLGGGRVAVLDDVSASSALEESYRGSRK